MDYRCIHSPNTSKAFASAGLSGSSIPVSFEEIERIKKLKDLAPELENTRKWMLIGFYSGQRVSDLLKLTEAQVRHAVNGVYIDVTQQKTGKHVTIGVSDPTTIKIIQGRIPQAAIRDTV